MTSSALGASHTSPPARSTAVLRTAPARRGTLGRSHRTNPTRGPLSAHLTAATARLLDLIREIDARGGWSHGFVSCAAWLTWRVGLAPGAAREHVRVARALGTLPRCGSGAD